MIVRCSYIRADGTPCGFFGEAGVSSHTFMCPNCGVRRKAPRERTTKRKLRLAEDRNAVLEQALVNVWRWTNDGHPHLELLYPILKQADHDARALVELAALEDQLAE